MIKKIIFFVLTAVLLSLFFSYRLTEVPSGITGDEAAFGYNAILLSRTLHDENGRKLPVFVLSLEGKDWRQPVTQYVDTVYFKIFNPSLFNLRFTSVIIAVISIFLIYFLGKSLLGNFGGIAAAIFLGTTPIFLIQSHLGLDNIAPIPFILVWLLSLNLFNKSKKWEYLVLSALSLGVGLYSYKAMRIFVPVEALLTVVYLAEEFLTNKTKKSFENVIRPVLIFSITLLPFFAIIPYLEKFYAGAVLNNEKFIFSGIYNFVYPYISLFDPSFLFIKGDDILTHSTGMHGMLLLASLPFFIFGLSYSWKKGSFWKLLIISFFLSPLLFGFMGSTHRASRILAEIPAYSLICASGFISIFERKNLRIILGILAILFVFNYFDFAHYYLFQYPNATKNIFNDFSSPNSAYKFLSEKSKGDNLTPLVDNVVAKREGEPEDFARAIYFSEPISLWGGQLSSFPKNGILMTDNDNIKFLKQIFHTGNYYFYITP
jgi:hypothetical protein